MRPTENSVKTKNHPMLLLLQLLKIYFDKNNPEFSEMLQILIDDHATPVPVAAAYGYFRYLTIKMSAAGVELNYALRQIFALFLMQNRDDLSVLPRCDHPISGSLADYIYVRSRTSSPAPKMENGQFIITHRGNSPVLLLKSEEKLSEREISEQTMQELVDLQFCPHGEEFDFAAQLRKEPVLLHKVLRETPPDQMKKMQSFILYVATPENLCRVSTVLDSQNNSLADHAKYANFSDLWDRLDQIKKNGNFPSPAAWVKHLWSDFFRSDVGLGPCLTEILKNRFILSGGGVNSQMPGEELSVIRYAARRRNAFKSHVAALLAQGAIYPRDEIVREKSEGRFHQAEIWAVRCAYLTLENFSFRTIFSNPKNHWLMTDDEYTFQHTLKNCSTVEELNTLFFACLEKDDLAKLKRVAQHANFNLKKCVSRSDLRPFEQCIINHLCDKELSAEVAAILKWFLEIKADFSLRARYSALIPNFLIVITRNSPALGGALLHAMHQHHVCSDARVVAWILGNFSNSTEIVSNLLARFVSQDFEFAWAPGVSGHLIPVSDYVLIGIDRLHDEDKKKELLKLFWDLGVDVREQLSDPEIAEKFLGNIPVKRLKPSPLVQKSIYSEREPMELSDGMEELELSEKIDPADSAKP